MLDLAPLRKAFARGKHRDTFEFLWKRYYQFTDGGRRVRDESKPYPTEPATVFLSAWACTAEEKYRDAAIRVFEYAHEREDDGRFVFHVPDASLPDKKRPVFNRDPQARQIYNFYTAYKIFGHLDYLQWADRCAASMLKHIRRVPHPALHRNLFAHNVITLGENPTRATSIDANMNCEIALAYTLLYHDPKSTYYQSAEARDIAECEVDAAFSLQKDDGSLPLNEDPAHKDHCDTAYGGYVGFSTVWLNQLWSNPKWARKIEKLGDWLGRYSKGKPPYADRYYSSRTAELRGWDLWYRIPVLWKCGQSPTALIETYLAQPEPSTLERGYLIFAYYEVMGIPPDVYLAAP